MKVRLCILATVLLVAAVASADTITFTLNESTASGNSCTGCGPFGTVTVSQDGTNTVLVTETLSKGVGFVKTGAGNALDFSIIGDPSITIGSLTSGFSKASPDNKGDTGSFDYAINCTGCGPGGSSPLAGPLSFTVTANGITPASFEVLNGKKFYVASDVIDKNVCRDPTGNAEATGFSTTSVVPEPASLGLLSTGLLGLAGILRRRFGV